MSKLTTAQRKALDIADFGDPGRRLFPIVDQDDVDSAARLIGKAQNPAAVKARIISIARRKGLKLPAAWQSEADMSRLAMRAEFGADAAAGRRVEGDDAIYPVSLLFRPGDYPDKDFSMTPEELWLAEQTFTPVSGNIEHTDFLRGRACQVRKVWLDDEGEGLRGEVSIPLGLDAILSQSERGLSCEWDRETKTLTGLALTVNPRVSDAALMTAFAAFASSDVSSGRAPGAPRHDTPSGQDFHQSVHDMAARAGAKCARSNSARMHSGHELEGIQQIHDTAVEHGAMCARIGGPSSVRYSAESGSDPQRGREGRPMKLWERIKQSLGPAGETELPADNAGDAGESGPAGEQSGAAGAAAGAAGAQMSAAAATLRPDPKIAALEAQVAALQAQRIQDAGVAFAQETVRSGRALPAEAAGIAALFCQAASDDAAHATQVQFGVDTAGKALTGSRVDALKASLAARPVNKLVSDSLQGLFNAQTTPGMDPAGDTAAEDAKAKAAAEAYAKTVNRPGKGTN